MDDRHLVITVSLAFLDAILEKTMTIAVVRPENLRALSANDLRLLPTSDGLGRGIKEMILRFSSTVKIP